MKKIFTFLLFISMTGCSDPVPSITTGLEGKPIPSFELLLMDSTTRLNTTNIPAGEPIVLFYFSPYCPYCRAQTQEIVDELKSLNHIRFYLLSNFPFHSVKQYYNHYQLKNYPNIIVGQDFAMYFERYFKASGVPYIAVYQKDKRLRQVLVGKVDTRVIKEIALE